MDPEIIGTVADAPGLEQAWQNWWASAQGLDLLAWEQGCADAWLADVFGFYALQLGRVSVESLRSNRMPFRWLAMADPGQAGVLVPGKTLDLLSDPRALPFAEQSLDLLVLAHALDGLDQPLAALREAHRVLVPEGRLLVLGLNPWSVWGLRQRSAQALQRLRSKAGVPGLPLPSVALPTLRHWLQVLGFADTVGLSSARAVCSHAQTPPLSAWRSVTQWGSTYAVFATKRVGGTKPLYALRRSRPQTGQSPVPVVTQNPHA